MIQVGSFINVADNSGALSCKCIHVYGGISFASVGDMVMVSIRSVVPNGKIRKGEKFLGVIVRSKKSSLKNSFSSISFSDNAVVLLNKQSEMVGTRVFGPVSRYLRQKEGLLKIISLAPESI